MMGRMIFQILLCLIVTSTISTSKLVALHDLVVVDVAGSKVTQLYAYNYDYITKNVVAKIVLLPGTGKLYQLSQVFDKYGYKPESGSIIQSNNTIVTGSNNRIVYKRPPSDKGYYEAWDIITFSMANEKDYSSVGMITFVPPSGTIVGSDFLLSNQNWMILGNKQSMPATHVPNNRGRQLSYYIYGADDKIVVDGGLDKALWYFQAPQKFLGNLGISYGGHFSFTLSSFAGNFQDQTNKMLYMVLLECRDCDGVLHKGITLGWPTRASSYDGSTQEFNLRLTEGAGWLKDSQNSLVAWTKPSKCDIIQVLSRLSSVKVLGDWTNWYETVALDNVRFWNTKGQLPACAQYQPDASICKC